MNGAVECIREIFPLSSIKTIRTECFKGKIAIGTNAFGQPREVWSGKISNLFVQFPKRRRKAMNIIKSKLAELKESLR